MRTKIIAVFSVIVALSSLVWFALLRAVPTGAEAGPEVRRTLHGALQSLELDGARLERWTAARATQADLREPFALAAAAARSETATAVASRVLGELGAAPAAIPGLAPAVALLVDAQGLVLGRSGSALMRGEDLGAVHPKLREVVQRGSVGTEFWVNRERSEQWLTAFATISAATGERLGGLVLGVSLGDERFSRIREQMGEANLLLVSVAGEKVDVVSKSQGTSAAFMDAFRGGSSAAKTLTALGAEAQREVGGVLPGWSVSAGLLRSPTSVSNLYLVSGLEQRPQGIPGLVWMTLGITALGLVLVAVAAVRLSQAASHPIAEVEERLLAILNGRTDLRVETEDPELGGLIFRINSLLNQLLGVAEEPAALRSEPVEVVRPSSALETPPSPGS